MSRLMIVRSSIVFMRIKGIREVRELVCCRECKHNYNKVLNHGKMKPRCDFTDRVLTENDFCSRGEREGE